MGADGGRYFIYFCWSTIASIGAKSHEFAVADGELACAALLVLDLETETTPGLAEDDSVCAFRPGGNGTGSLRSQKGMWLRESRR